MAPSRKARCRAPISVCKHDSGDCRRVYSTRRHPAPDTDSNKVTPAGGNKRSSIAKPKPAVKQQAPLRTGRRKDPKVEALVYRFLGNLAAIESDRRESIRSSRRRPAIHFSERGRGTKRRPHSEEHPRDGGRARRRRFRSPTPYSWDRFSPADSSLANSLLDQEPRLLDCSDSSADEAEDAAGLASRGAGGGRGRPAHIAQRLQLASSTSELLNQQPTSSADRNLLQRIHRYLSDGIAEGKRRAQRYVRKALLFALEMGYLTFADREGKLLRVSPEIQPGLSLQQHRPAPEASSQPSTTTTTTTTSNGPSAPGLRPSVDLGQPRTHQPDPGVEGSVPAPGGKPVARKRAGSRATRLRGRRTTTGAIATTKASLSRAKRRSSAANKRSASRARAARRRLRAKSLNGAAAARAQRKRESSLGAAVPRKPSAVVGGSSGNERIRSCAGAGTVAKIDDQQQQSQQSRPISNDPKRESSRQTKEGSRSSSRCACKDTSGEKNDEASAPARRPRSRHSSRGRRNSQPRDDSQQHKAHRDRSKSASSRGSGHNQDSHRRTSADLRDH